jgi:capsule polysaccharide export protein KpsE/RkpR
VVPKDEVELKRKKNKKTDEVDYVHIVASLRKEISQLKQTIGGQNHLVEEIKQQEAHYEEVILGIDLTLLGN